MNNYILIQGLASYKLILIDRKKYRIIEIDTLSKTIKEITKEILNYYNKYELYGFSIFKAFIDGNYNKYDLIEKTDELEEISIPFNLDNYYLIFDSLTSKEKKENIIKYDENNKNRFLFEKKEC